MILILNRHLYIDINKLIKVKIGEVSMRKIIVLAFLFVLFSILFSTSLIYAAVVSYSSPMITATLLSQSPDPVEPGQVVKVKFKIENAGKETYDDVIAKINLKYPFTIYNDIAEKNIGMLRGRSTGADAVVVEFKLKVDEKAVEEETELELQIWVGEGAVSYTDDEFLIDIQTHDAVLDITSITSEPEQIAPGETAEINILVKNLADSLLKDIQFKLNFDSASLPLAPYQSSSEKRISQLQTNYQNSLTFQVIADPGAAAGLYKVPLNITYYDEKGTKYSVSDVLAVTIGEAPLLRAYIKKSDVLQDNKNGKITLEIANAGSSDVKFLELFLLPSGDYKLVSTTDYYYFGDVDSDDTESEEINIFVNKGIETLHIPMKIKYTDANNVPFQQEFELELELYSASELRKFGIVKTSKSGLYLILVIFVVAGFFFYRRYKKHPEKWSQLKKRIPFFNKRGK